MKKKDRISEDYRIAPTAFDSVDFNDKIYKRINRVHEAIKECAIVLNVELYDNEDKGYALRLLREVQMWSNMNLVRHSDGTTRGHIEKIATGSRLLLTKRKK